MLRRTHYTAAFLLTIAGLSHSLSGAEPLSVASPDGKLSVSVAVKVLAQPYLGGERLYYRVSYRGEVILTDSPLGLDFWGGKALDEDLRVTGTDKQTHNSTWENLLGAKRVVPDHYNELKVRLEEKKAPGRRVEVIFRAYNEGVALRYFLPQQAGLQEFALASENTGFYFAREVEAYVMNMGRFNTHNEAEYVRMKLSEIKPSSIINVPILVEIPGGPWVALLEADLTDYAGMYVSAVAGRGSALMTQLSKPPRKETVARNLPWPEYQRMEQPVRGKTPSAMPWRVLMIAPTPGRLIETNYLILNLNPPNKLADSTWIKPGKAMWDWWTGSYAENVPFTPGMNTPTMKHYIDFAARHHIEYMLIDAGWYSVDWVANRHDLTKSSPDIDIIELVNHAREKGVKLILWVEWRALDRQLDEALSLYEKWGVAGIKVDGIDRDDQEMVNLYEKWTRKAAQYHLIVDFHGAYKPTGMRRTYPNLLLREAVMGMEYSKWSDRVTPEFNVTIPFTRMLAGPMDYTPGGFHNTIRGQFKIQDIAPMTQGTRAHQLAMYVVYEGPLVMLADYPEAYEGQPGLEFIEKVPTVWDETKFLNGEVGKYITLARQKDNAWYIGAMTNWDARDLEIPLTFLGSSEYEAQIFADGPDADKVASSLALSTKRVTATDTLRTHLAPGGGLAVMLRPIGE
jgi:alpha-glucosidase